jgi:hypothetical protein
MSKIPKRQRDNDSNVLTRTSRSTEAKSPTLNLQETRLLVTTVSMLVDIYKNPLNAEDIEKSSQLLLRVFKYANIDSPESLYNTFFESWENGARLEEKKRPNVVPCPYPAQFDPKLHVLVINIYPVLQGAMYKLATNCQLFPNCKAKKQTSTSTTFEWD